MVRYIMLTHLHVNLKQNEIIHLKLFMIVLMSCIPEKTYHCQHNLSWSLETLTLDGHFTFDNNDFAARDFGNTHHLPSAAVLHPRSVSDISATLAHIHEQGPASGLTVAARGHGHSLQGQSQAHRGLVIRMESLREGQKIRVVCDEDGGSPPFADVSGGELWIDILRETLRQGLAPKSWTDYLYLTVGGTLSNAGISGQAFRHGPQISNVHELEVVTGTGVVVNCSERENSDLFHAVLGGLGQFGIITRARISLEPASEMVKWIRVLYSDFSLFSEDQERLISSLNSSFDYIEGFVIINRTGLLNSWRSSFDPKDPVRASQFSSDGRTLYCIEMAMYFNPNNKDMTNKKIEKLLSELSFIPSTLFQTEVTYLDFLNRVHIAQQKLQAQGLWDVPHPWLNLLVPKRNIHKFAKGVFGKIVKYSSNGPILIYPMNISKWNNKTSLVTPEGDDIIYLVGFLSSAVPSSTGKDGLEHILTRNRKILDFCERARLGTKQYLPHYGTQEEWRGHFGPKWPVFLRRKLAYDPFATLGPGHRIFEKATWFRDT